MSKSYRSNNEDSDKPNYRAMGSEHRSLVAMGMIVSGQGRKQVFADKRNKRSKERKDWMREEER